MLVTEEQPVAARCGPAPGAPAGSRGTGRCRCPGPTMIIGVAPSSGGRKCGDGCRNTGTACVGPVGEEGRATPRRGRRRRAAVAHHRHRQLHLVRAHQRADEIEYDRGVSRTSTSCHSSGSARTANSSTTSSPLRPPSHASELASVAAQQLGRVAVRTCSATKPSRFGRHPADVVGRASARRAAAISAPSTSTDSVAASDPVAVSHASTTAAAFATKTPSASPAAYVDVVLGDVEAELPHLLRRAGGGQQRCCGTAARARAASRVNGSAAVPRRGRRGRHRRAADGRRPERDDLVGPLAPSARRRRPRSRRARASWVAPRSASRASSDLACPQKSS